MASPGSDTAWGSGGQGQNTLSQQAVRLLTPLQSVDRDDPGGRFVHLVLACLAGVLITGPTTVLEIAPWPAAVYAVMRAPRIWRVYTRTIRGPLVLLLLALAAWLGLGVIGSPDMAVALDEVGGLRWAVLCLAILPVVGADPTRRGMVVWSVLAGVAVGHVVQGLQFIGFAAGIEPLTFGRFRDRISGWWDPAVSATVLTVALGLALPLAIGGGWDTPARRRARLIAALAAGAALVGVLLSGARAGWIASAGVIGIVFVAAVMTRRVGVRAAAAIVLAASVLVGGAIAGLGDRLTGRLSAAAGEVTAAIEQGDYASDTGARIGMKLAAIEITRDHPIAGAGGGSFRTEATARIEAAAAEEPDAPVWRPPDHAHDQWLHTLATRGVIGVALLSGLLGRLLWNAVRIGRDARLGARGAGGRAWTINDGPWAAAVGLLLMTPFDCVLISSQSAALAAMLLALCPDRTAWSPVSRARPGPDDGAGV